MAFFGKEISLSSLSVLFVIFVTPHLRQTLNNPVVESAAACLIGVGLEERGLTPPLLLPLAVVSILPISDSKSDSLLSLALLFDEESSLLPWNSVTKFSKVLGQRFSLLERRFGDIKAVLVIVQKYLRTSGNRD